MTTWKQTKEKGHITPARHGWPEEIEQRNEIQGSLSKMQETIDGFVKSQTESQAAAKAGLPGLAPTGHLGKGITEDIDVLGTEPNAAMANAPFGVVDETSPVAGPHPDPAVEAALQSIEADTATSSEDSGAPGAPGGSAGSPSGGGDSGNIGDFHRGGRVTKGPPKGPERRATLLEKEFVVNAKAAKLHHTLLNAINSGATKNDLARLLRERR